MAVRRPLVLVAGAVSELPTADTLAGGGSPTAPHDFKDSVDVATTANITLSGEQTIDGVATAASRVLVKNNTVGSENGWYLSAAGAWARTADADTSIEVTSGAQVYVESGTVNGGQVFVLTTPDPITLDTTALTFTAAPIAPATFVGKTVAGTTYTHVIADSGRRLNCTNAAAKTVTVAPQSSVASPVNTEIEVFNAGAGLLTLAPGSGVTLNSADGRLTLRQYEYAKLKKRANPNTWDVTVVDGATRAVTALAISSGVVNIDCALGDYFILALTANVTSITFTNLPGSGKGATKWVEIVQDSTPRTVAWPASFKWAGGAAGAVSTANGAIDELAITTLNNGTAWKATLAKAFA